MRLVSSQSPSVPRRPGRLTQTVNQRSPNFLYTDRAHSFMQPLIRTILVHLHLANFGDHPCPMGFVMYLAIIPFCFQSSIGFPSSLLHQFLTPSHSKAMNKIAQFPTLPQPRFQRYYIYHTLRWPSDHQARLAQ